MKEKSIQAYKHTYIHAYTGHTHDARTLVLQEGPKTLPSARASSGRKRTVVLHGRGVVPGLSGHALLEGELRALALLSVFACMYTSGLSRSESLMVMSLSL